MSITKIQECSECTILKGWGHELIIHNSEKYCGKLLVFKAGCKFSMHYHLLKQETWYVNKGTFIYHWIDTNQGTTLSTRLTVGDVVTQYPGQPHQLEALEEGEIFEVSTQHFDTDSYRIWKGD
jgi:quercetin dioxygenase-like cupin family protein